jgi:hypothetical protein
MRAWVARRRNAGAMLESPIPFGGTPDPCELMVVEVTDQGARRPTRVARLVPPGTRVAVAELIAPRLVWFSGWDLVLSGIEERIGDTGVTGASQSWICRLAPPRFAVGFLARHTNKDGVELKRGAIFDRYGASTKGRLAVAGAHNEALGRHTMRADLSRPNDTRGMLSGALLDVELGWMSEERFALSGFHQHGAYEERPARLLRQGWLCEYEIDEPADERPLRNARPQG